MAVTIPGPLILLGEEPLTYGRFLADSMTSARKHPELAFHHDLFRRWWKSTLVVRIDAKKENSVQVDPE